MAGGHHHHTAVVPAQVARVLWIAVGAWAAVTLIAVIALWLGSRQVGDPEFSPTSTTFFLAHAGASLPLSLPFSETRQSVAGAVRSEHMAEVTGGGVVR